VGLTKKPTGLFGYVPRCLNPDNICVCKTTSTTSNVRADVIIIDTSFQMLTDIEKALKPHGRLMAHRLSGCVFINKVIHTQYNCVESQLLLQYDIFGLCLAMARNHQCPMSHVLERKKIMSTCLYTGPSSVRKWNQ